MAVVLLGGAMVAGCGEGATDGSADGEAAADTAPECLQTPSKAIELAAEYKTPDGMTNAADGSIILAVPSCLDEGDAPLVKIMPDDTVVPWFTLPAHPETKKATPLGIAFGSDGNLYVADSQDIGGDPTCKGRLLRVVVEDGKPTKAEVLATGFYCPNGLACLGDKVYFCETKVVETPSAPMVSGVFCFDIAELDPANVYEAKPYVSPEDKDPHFIYEFETNNPDWTVGANGLGFSPDGKMYVCNFGEQSLVEVTLGEDGKTFVSDRTVAKGDPMESTDGLKVDPETGLVYIADFVGNAVHEVDPKTGAIRCIASTVEPSTGEGGALDKCSEVCLRDGKIYVANIDLPFGNENDAPSTITILDLPEPAAAE